MMLVKGSFYSITQDDSAFILEDKTKSGLTVRDTSIDEQFAVKADKGMIHDMDGVGHWVPIRWFFPKCNFDLKVVVEFAESLDAKYTKLRELTCPDNLNS